MSKKTKPKLMIDKINKFIKDSNMDVLTKIAEDLYGKNPQSKVEFINKYLKYNYYTLDKSDLSMDKSLFINKNYINKNLKKNKK